MLTYDICLALKKAGFPQKEPNSWSPQFEKLEEYIPTLSELIEACGEGFKELTCRSKELYILPSNMWVACMHEETGKYRNWCFPGFTPEKNRLIIGVVEGTCESCKAFKPNVVLVEDGYIECTCCEDPKFKQDNIKFHAQ